MKHELRALTSVRGIAAWLVVLFHLRRSIDGLPTPAMDFLSKGYLAVDFFFLLSGFVIWMSYADRIRAQGLAAVPEFLKRRIARIWPLHLFMLGVAVALALLLTLTGREATHFPFAELPFHVFLLQNWGFTSDLTWNDPAWSISCELGAYLVFPILALAIDWRRVPTFAIIAAIAALMALLHTLFAANHATALGQAIPKLGLLRCILEFVSGTAICALWIRWRDHWVEPAAISATLSAILLAAWISGALPETLTVPAAFAAALLALALTAGRRGNPLESAPLHYLGEISYATYLSHYMFWFAFKLVLVDTPKVGWPTIALFLALVLPFSAALYHFVERPAQRWINNWHPRTRIRATI